MVARIEKREFSFRETQSELQGQWTLFVIELISWFLVRNVFDWGTKEVVDIIEKGEFSFGEAQTTRSVDMVCYRTNLWVFSA